MYCANCATPVGRKLIQGRFHLRNVVVLEIKPLFVKVPRGTQLMMEARAMACLKRKRELSPSGSSGNDDFPEINFLKSGSGSSEPELIEPGPIEPGPSEPQPGPSGVVFGSGTPAKTVIVSPVHAENVSASGNSTVVFAPGDYFPQLDLSVQLDSYIREYFQQTRNRRNSVESDVIVNLVDAVASVDAVAPVEIDDVANVSNAVESNNDDVQQ